MRTASTALVPCLVSILVFSVSCHRAPRSAEDSRRGTHERFVPAHGSPFPAEGAANPLMPGVLPSGGAGGEAVPAREVRSGDWRIRGPYTHGNLAVYLVLGSGEDPGHPVLTLAEGIERNLVVVHETGNVQQLAIENRSPDSAMYVQAGDIVKGGKQDRVLTVDLLLPPASERLPISSFCVESGRWSRRGSEPPERFHAAHDKLPSKGLKVAAKLGRNQQRVWSEVGDVQGKLAGNVDRGRFNESDNNEDYESGNRGASDSSLQHTMESRAVKESVEACVGNLKPLAEGADGAIGFAYAINGEINSAEIYAWPSLFRKLWPPLLKAACVEALAERKKGAPAAAAAPSPEAVAAFLRDAEGGAATEKEVGGRCRMVTREKGTHLLFESRLEDVLGGGEWIHRNYIYRGLPAGPEPRENRR